MIHVLSFDLNTSTAQAAAWVKTLLAYTSVDQDKVGAAASSWRELLELVGSATPTAGSYTRDQLPESLRQRHSGIGSAEQTALQALKDHSATIFAGIRDSIGDTLVIRRDQLVTQLLERLEEDRVVVVSGPAGHGKSVLGKHAVEILHRDHFAFAFRAEEFATSHLDETLHRAQLGVGAERLLALLAGQGRKLLVIESVERLLEASVRDAFADLLDLAKRDESWQIILTCRDYSIDVVRSSFLEHAGLPHAVVGSATQVMLTTRCRATVGKNTIPMREANSSYDRPRRVPSVWIDRVQEKRPYSQRQTEPSVQGVWTPVCG